MLSLRRVSLTASRNVFWFSAFQIYTLFYIPFTHTHTCICMSQLSFQLCLCLCVSFRRNIETNWNESCMKKVKSRSGMERKKKSENVKCVVFMFQNTTDNGWCWRTCVFVVANSLSTENITIGWWRIISRLLADFCLLVLFFTKFTSLIRKYCRANAKEIEYLLGIFGVIIFRHILNILCMVFFMFT